MESKEIRLHVILIAFSITSFGCDQKKSHSPMDAHLNAGLYTNSFYGFTLRVPTNWVVLNEADIENTASRPHAHPKEMRNPSTDNLIGLPDVEMYNLITLVQQTNLFPDKTLTALGTSNLSFSVFGQNVLPFKEIRTDKDYLGMLVNIFAIVSGPTCDLTNAGPAEVLAGGRQFCRDTFWRNMKTVHVHQRIYSRVDGGYALVFVLTAPGEGDLDKLEQIMATVQFH